MSNHTPGPWDKSAKGWYVGKRAANGSLDAIADLSEGVFRGMGDEERMANASLMAAAPELLECLKWMREQRTTWIGKEQNDMMFKIDATIRKAGG